MILTSRLSNGVAEAVLVNPQGLTLRYLDGVLDELISQTVGAGRFTDRQRETIRTHLKALIEELAGPGQAPAEIPMMAVVLMLRRANDLVALDEQSGLAQLPSGFAALVLDYVGQLLRDDAVLIGVVRAAAVACVGQDFAPSWRPMNAYASEGVTVATMKGLVESGLLLKRGAADDPQFKFALDPVSEYLAAREYQIRIRDGRLTKVALDRNLRRAGANGDNFARILGEAAGGSAVAPTEPPGTRPRKT